MSPCTMYSLYAGDVREQCRAGDQVDGSDAAVLRQLDAGTRRGTSLLNIISSGDRGVEALVRGSMAPLPIASVATLCNRCSRKNWKRDIVLPTRNVARGTSSAELAVDLRDEFRRSPRFELLIRSRCRTPPGPKSP